MASSYNNIRLRQPKPLQQAQVHALQALYKDVWGNPKSLVSQHTVQYQTVNLPAEMKSVTRPTFQLQSHWPGILALGFHLKCQLLVTQEYEDALQYFKSRFSEELDLEKAVRGFVVIGQPGIGR